MVREMDGEGNICHTPRVSLEDLSSLRKRLAACILTTEYFVELKMGYRNEIGIGGVNVR